MSSVDWVQPTKNSGHPLLPTMRTLVGAEGGVTSLDASVVSVTLLLIVVLPLKSFASTANVYVAPLMARYLEDLERRLTGLAVPGQLYVMQSSGGIALPPLARRLPIRLVESGPAAGALAAAQAARERGESRLLSFDMGGTTAKACVIDGGAPLVAREFEVARADRFGLADLYQLRGRVGRSHHRAYCYLLTPPRDAMTDEAEKRLRVLEEHTELGAGYRIALHDLEMRGAGNLLGADQSGFIAAVGFETYLRLLEETIGKLKGEEERPAAEPELAFDADAFLPDRYVTDAQQKLALYRRLARLRDPAAIDDFRAELADAQRDGKKALFVMFEQDGCPGCLYMKEHVLSRPDVQKFYRDHFISFSINIYGSVRFDDFAGRKVTEKTFAQATDIKGTPTFIFYDLEGHEIVRKLGAIRNVDEFILFGEFVASGAYRSRKFADYLKERKAGKGS